MWFAICVQHVRKSLRRRPCLDGVQCRQRSVYRCVVNPCRRGSMPNVVFTVIIVAAVHVSHVLLHDFRQGFPQQRLGEEGVKSHRTALHLDAVQLKRRQRHDGQRREPRQLPRRRFHGPDAFGGLLPAHDWHFQVHQHHACRSPPATSNENT